MKITIASNGGSFEHEIISDSKHMARRISVDPIEYNLLKSNDPAEFAKFYFMFCLMDDYNDIISKHPELDKNVDVLKCNLHDCLHNGMVQMAEGFLRKIPHDDMDKRILEKLCYYKCCDGISYDVHYETTCQQINTDLMKAIIFVASNYPELITEQCYDAAYNNRNETVINVLKYYDPTEYETECYICSSGALKHTLITGICECKTHVHIECAQKVIETNGRVCKTCRWGFRCNERRNIETTNGYEVDSKVFFPFIGIYPKLSFQKDYIKAENSSERLFYAIMYLQYNEVLHELATLNDPEIMRKIISHFYYGLCHRQTDKLVLLENMTSNYPRSLNENACKRIENAVNKYLRN